MSRIGIVLRKEVVDNLRDRRTLMTSFVTPLLGPLLLVLLLVMLGRSVTERSEKRLELPVQGREHAPNLVEYLESQGVDILEPPAEPELAVRAGERDMVLRIPAGFGESLREGRPAAVELILDESRDAAAVEVGRVENLLLSYGGQMGSLRLLARGVDPSITAAVDLRRRDVSTEQSQGARILGMAPYFIILSIFVGGLYLAIDTTAGERERGSLEPLLTTASARSDLVLGKVAATLCFTVAALVETLLGFVVVLNAFPLERYLGMRLSLSWSALGVIFLLSLPMTLPAAALQMVIATFTRSFKEAQNYLSLLPLVPALPGLFLVFLPVRPEMWMMLIPTYGQQILINRALRGEPLDLAHCLVSAAMSVVVGGLLVAVAVRLYRRERLLFTG